MRPLVSLLLLACMFVASPVTAQPTRILVGEPHQALFADEDDGDFVFNCAPELLPYIQGVERVASEAEAQCIYHRTRRVRVGGAEGPLLTFVLHRYASEHEESSTVRETVALLDEDGRVFATLSQLDILQEEAQSRLRLRRFRITTLHDEHGSAQPALCVETMEERGPGTFDVLALEQRHRPWRPSTHHRAVDAWLFDFTPRGVHLIRRSALDGACPARGYTRFVEGDPETLGAVELRRTLGEVELADAAPAEARPTYFVPWRRGQRIRLRDVRRAFPGYTQYWHDTVGYENSPDTLEPILCVGRGNRCLLRISLINPSDRSEPEARLVPTRDDSARFAGEILVRDGSIEGPDGIRVGASYSALASSLQDCVALYGDFVGMTCRAVHAPSVYVQLDGDGFSQCDINSQTPCSAALETARVVEFNLARP